MAEYTKQAVKALDDIPRIESMDDLRKLTPDQINKHWPVVSAILETGKPPRKSAAPQTLEDVKGLDRDAVIEHWETVVKILERQAALDAAQRKAIAQRKGEAAL